MADIAVTTTLELFPEGREPVDMGEVTRWVNREIAIGRRAAVTIAVLIAHARDAYYPEEPPEWLDWARKEFGYQRRFCFQCLAAGRLLLQCTSDALDSNTVAALVGCDIQKLELLWPLARKKPEQFRALLSAWNPAEHGRDAVSAKVAGFLGDEAKKATCTRCKTEFEPSRRKQELCEACETAAKKKTAERKGASTDKILADLAGLDEPAKAALAAEIAPAIAMRAGLNAVELSLMSVDAHGGWSEDDFARWGPKLGEVVESFRYVASKNRSK